MLPKQITCDGAGTAPPLSWSHVPKGVAELALLVEDPDAPGGTFVHWTVYGVKPGTTRIEAGSAPPGAEGKNSFGDTGYGPPCPPPGDSPHRYVFTLYALSQKSGLEPGASPKEVRAAVAKSALARGSLTGRYAR
jgi:Raf kinase inhibitor-like YbhB/YbcL family protein